MKNKISRARNLRKQLTDAEMKLWYRLRRRQLNNFRFRKQVPMGPYIADFVCHETGLIIELDGGQHSEGEAINYDKR